VIWFVSYATSAEHEIYSARGFVTDDGFGWARLQLKGFFVIQPGVVPSFRVRPPNSRFSAGATGTDVCNDRAGRGPVGRGSRSSVPDAGSAPSTRAGARPRI